MPVSEEFKHTVGKAIGRIPSGVFILTAAHEGQTAAMMASTSEMRELMAMVSSALGTTCCDEASHVNRTAITNTKVEILGRNIVVSD